MWICPVMGVFIKAARAPGHCVPNRFRPCYQKSMAISRRHIFKLGVAALALGAGGVGFYPASDFIHMDTGRVRSWG